MSGSHMRSPLKTCLIAGIAFVFLCQSITWSQSTNDARPVPAPWRPSFGQIEQPVANTNGSPTNGVSTQPTRAPQGINLETGALRAPGSSPSALPGSSIQPPAGQQFPSANGRAGSGSASPNQDTTNGPPRFSPTPRVAQSDITRITKTMNMLPNDDGQIWRSMTFRRILRTSP